MNVKKIADESLKFQKEIANFMSDYTDKNFSKYDDSTKIKMNMITAELLLSHMYITNIDLGIHNIEEVSKGFNDMLEFIKNKLKIIKKNGN